MAEKTSWTKPPSLHRYGDSKLTAPPSEARLRRCVLRPPEGSGERTGEEGGGGGPEEGHVQRSRPSAQAGSAAFQCGSERTGVATRRSGHGGSPTGAGSGEGRVGEEGRSRGAPDPLKKKKEGRLGVCVGSKTGTTSVG